MKIFIDKITHLPKEGFLALKRESQGEAKIHFYSIQLRTDNKSAAAFYEKYGFKKVTNNISVTHELFIQDLKDF